MNSAAPREIRKRACAETLFNYMYLVDCFFHKYANFGRSNSDNHFYFGSHLCTAQ